MTSVIKLWAGECSMLRLRILASVIPLAVVAIITRGGLLGGTHPCIAVADSSVQLASLPWQSGPHVSFTSDPERATVRVQLVDSPEAADFAVIDDIDNDESGACESNGIPQFVSIEASPQGRDPVIYLAQDGPADYRIFVRSKSFSAREAAALIVGARGGHHRVQSASL